MQDTAAMASASASREALEKAANEASMLMDQVCQLEMEREKLQKDLEEAQRRESSLQTLLDGQQPGDPLVMLNVHTQVMHENKSLKAQVEQLKQDLEQVYRDGHFTTQAGGPGESGHSGSHMTTAHRLASLLAPSDMRGSHMSFAVRSKPYMVSATPVEIVGTLAALCHVTQPVLQTGDLYVQRPIRAADKRILGLKESL
jgi:outer membrane murein-binding lipoprotein Lpp